MTTPPRLSRIASLAAATAAVVALGAAGAAQAADRSAGLYVIPFSAGTDVKVTGDHLTHNPPNRIDMVGLNGDDRITAAAAGTIRFIQDGFSEKRPGGSPCNNNYVWIEHANGEWTKYSHMRKNSVGVDAGLDVGDTVQTGRFLGIQSDVGCASGKHLHFQVSVPASAASPIDSQGFMSGEDRTRGSAASPASSSSRARPTARRASSPARRSTPATASLSPSTRSSSRRPPTAATGSPGSTATRTAASWSSTSSSAPTPTSAPGARTAA